MTVDKSKLKEIILKEYAKCKADPVYFLVKHAKIQHPQRGRIPFHLYPFQREVLHLLNKGQNSIILKSRQLGISTLTAGYALWLMTFHPDKNILVLATTQKTARNLVRKVHLMYDNLPSWLRLEYSEKNKLSLALKNGSRIQAASSASDAARSEAVSLLVLDEAAFIDNIEDTFAAAQQTLATGGVCIALSTPNGIGNWFHETYQKATYKKNSFTPIRLPWQVHPERDESWRRQQDEDLGPRMAAQECDCDFLSSGDTVFEPEDMTFYEETYVKEPVERRGLDGNYWIWEHPNYNKSYLVCADVSRGDGRDYSTAHVLDLETATQVAEYQGKMSPKEFGNFLVTIGTEYGGAIIVVDNKNVGWATVEQILEREYPNLYYSPRTEGQNDVEKYMTNYENNNLVPGFTTSTRNRPLVIGKLLEYVGDKSLVIQSKRTTDEMRTFIWKNGKAQSQDRYNDDLIMALGYGVYVRDTALKLYVQGQELTRAQLQGFSNLNKQPDQTPVVMSNVNRGYNPYSLPTRQGHTEDISWLLD